MKRVAPRILATLHEETAVGIRVTRVALDKPPVAVVPALDSVLGLWWFHADDWPVGQSTGTFFDR
ncbi:MAG: hypothetical protein WC100_00840 [Sterolibacterium sp.]